jgi:Mg/Co/Ni transporter MgtE
VAGKADWIAAGLPWEGKLAGEPRVGELARRDVPVCSRTATVGQARQRAAEAGWTSCVVVDQHRVVLGLLRRRALAVEPSTPVEQAMDPGPSTFRASVRLEEMAHFLRQHELTQAWLTTSAGRLVGLLERETLERKLAELATAKRGVRMAGG